MRARLVVALAVIATAAGCYHNPLPDYAPRIRSMTVRIAVPQRPYVQVDAGVHHGGLLGAAEMVATGVSVGVTAGVRTKLLAAVPAKRVQGAVEQAFHGPMAGSLPFPIAKGPGDQPTARLEVTVTGYGIYAGDNGADAVYTFYTHARLIYLPEAKILWEDGTRAQVPVTWDPGTDTTIPTTSRTGAQVANLAVLGSVDQKRLQKVFDVLAHDAAQVLVRDLGGASARH